jgi:predicted DNA binding protein
MLEVVFDRTSASCWAQEVSENFPELRMEVLAIQGELGLSKWTSSRPKTLEEAFHWSKDHSTIIGMQKLQQSNHRTSMLVETRCSCESGRVHSVLEKFDCHYLLPNAIVTQNGKRRYRILVTNEENLDLLLSELNLSGEAKIVSIRSLRSEGPRRILMISSVLEDLTLRQREILLSAYQYGYFDIPHAITIDELAQKLGLHKATVHEHLRKAERTIMRNFAGLIG